jgi:hypothetical protein
VVSRRLFLAGGAVALLAACGKEDEPAAPRPADVLLRSLAAERALAAAASRTVARRARERARRLASAVAEQGGRPHDAPAAGAKGRDPAAAARTALVAHVESLPALRGDLRALAADMIVGAAADLAALGGEAEAFPGTPA